MKEKTKSGSPGAHFNIRIDIGDKELLDIVMSILRLTTEVVKLMIARKGRN